MIAERESKMEALAGQVKQPVREPQGLVGCDTVCRESARGMLERRIERLNFKINNLRVIRDMLPTKLTSEQDQAVWNLLEDTRNW